MNNILRKAVASVRNSVMAFTKFITANDTGATGGHQSGFHIHKSAWAICFPTQGMKGENKDRKVVIRWQDDFETQSRFIYYGVGTRNEYRLTRFGRGFPYLSESNCADLLVLCKVSENYYEAFVLQSDDLIDSFFSELNISINDVNALIPQRAISPPEEVINKCFYGFVNMLKTEFPSTVLLSKTARNCYNDSYKVTSDKIRENPDEQLLAWLDAEFQLFKLIESRVYSKSLMSAFGTVEELIEFSNTILNRRKSRAGKSLENHLSEIFTIFELLFSNQARTEDKKRPDFIFPSQSAYSNKRFREDKLTFLAAKTTCKDRWRQILNEADRIRTKHLFTLQQGISGNQLIEMEKSNVTLVIPKPNIESFPKQYRSKILTLDRFIENVLIKQAD